MFFIHPPKIPPPFSLLLRTHAIITPLHFSIITTTSTSAINRNLVHRHAQCTPCINFLHNIHHRFFHPVHCNSASRKILRAAVHIETDETDPSLLFSLPRRSGPMNPFFIPSRGGGGRPGIRNEHYTTTYTTVGCHALTQGCSRRVSRLGRLSGANTRQDWIKSVACR